MKRFYQLITITVAMTSAAGCMESGTSSKSSSTDSSSSSGSSTSTSTTTTTTTTTSTATATSSSSSSSGSSSSGCISGDGTGADGVYSFTADGSGGNRVSGDGMTASGSGYVISGGHIWSLSKDSDVADKEVLGTMDQGGSVEIMVQPQTNPGAESVGSVTYCNTGTNYSRLTMTVLLGKYKSGIFYPSDEETFTAVNTGSCSSSISFSVPSYNLSSTEYPDIVVKSVKSDGECISYGASCSSDPLVPNKSCWRTKVFVKLQNATSW